MGLDQYLSGRKFMTFENVIKDDEGNVIEEIVVKLGYWRKHSDLHGYIVETFGPRDHEDKAVDDCREIELSIEDLHQLLEAVKKPKKNLPKTTGFFFGESAHDKDQIKEDIAIFTKAIGFLEAGAVLGDSNKVWRSVIYRASW
jgi:hypothetical protein